MNRLNNNDKHSKLLEMLNVMKLRRTSLLLLSVFFFTFSGYAQDTVEPSLNTEEIALTSWLDSQEGNMLEMLERITNINSGSLNKQGVNELASIFSEELRQLGFSLSTLPGEVIEMPSCPGSDYNVDVADHILASKNGSGSKLLIMGHLDTVFPPSSQFQKFSREGDTMYGVGFESDMDLTKWKIYKPTGVIQRDF